MVILKLIVFVEFSNIYFNFELLIHYWVPQLIIIKKYKPKIFNLIYEVICTIY